MRTQLPDPPDQRSIEKAQWVGGGGAGEVGRGYRERRGRRGVVPGGGPLLHTSSPLHMKPPRFVHATPHGEVL